jgi:hypothetical protein
MKQFVQCKACGYIMEASKVGALCPACGVPAKAFEPYTERISEERKRILDLHIHPIVVHLAQAIVPMLLFLVAVLFVVGEGRLREAIRDTAMVLAAFLPFAVILAFAAGLFDGRLRFHKVTTPLLRLKMLVGFLFFAASVGGALIAVLTGLDASAQLAAFAAIQLGALGAAVFLGQAGFSLLSSRFPG